MAEVRFPNFRPPSRLVSAANSNARAKCRNDVNSVYVQGIATREGFRGWVGSLLEAFPGKHEGDKRGYYSPAQGPQLRLIALAGEKL